MTTEETEARVAAPRTVLPRFRLGRGWRQTTLVVHVLAAGAWIGVDVIVGVLVLVGWFGGDVETRSLAYRALGVFVVGPMLTAALVSLVSGLILGLGTRWGLVRYWWVAVKLVLNLLLCTLIVVLLQPGMDDVSRYGEELLTGSPEADRVSKLFMPPAVSLSALTLATVLSVVKPWGRLRRDHRRRSDRSAVGSG